MSGSTNPDKSRLRDLDPCPFCGVPLAIRGGRNPYGRCDTDGCWMHERAITVPMHDPTQVTEWNTRAPAEIERLQASLASTGEPVAWRWRYVYPYGPGHWNVRQRFPKQQLFEAYPARPGLPAREVEPLYLHPATGEPSKVREAAFREAAAVAFDKLYPNNLEDDWTPYACDSARHARFARDAILSRIEDKSDE